MKTLKLRASALRALLEELEGEQTSIADRVHAFVESGDERAYDLALEELRGHGVSETEIARLDAVVGEAAVASDDASSRPTAASAERRERSLAMLDVALGRLAKRSERVHEAMTRDVMTAQERQSAPDTTRDSFGAWEQPPYPPEPKKPIETVGSDFGLAATEAILKRGHMDKEDIDEMLQDDLPPGLAIAYRPAAELGVYYKISKRTYDVTYVIASFLQRKGWDLYDAVEVAREPDSSRVDVAQLYLDWLRRILKSTRAVVDRDGGSVYTPDEWIGYVKRYAQSALTGGHGLK